MKDLVIIGSGGLGRETLWTVDRINAVKPEWNVLGFLDDNIQLQGKTVDGYKMLGTIDDIVKYKDAYFICTIGRARVRKSVVERIKKIADVKYATLIDPSCVYGGDKVKFGEGCIVCSNTYITVNIEVGSHVYIGGNGTIGHDARVEDYVTLYPGVNVSGSTHLASGCELGTGTQIIQGLSVGKNTIVGAGAVIIRDLPENCTCVGVPARPIKRS